MLILTDLRNYSNYHLNLSLSRIWLCHLNLPQHNIVSGPSTVDGILFFLYLINILIFCSLSTITSSFRILLQYVQEWSMLLLPRVHWALSHIQGAPLCGRMSGAFQDNKDSAYSARGPNQPRRVLWFLSPNPNCPLCSLLVPCLQHEASCWGFASEERFSFILIRIKCVILSLLINWPRLHENEAYK